MSHRYISGQIDRATHRSIIAHQLTRSLKIGVEINQAVREVGAVANWRIADETSARPAFILGTSSDRIGTPTGRSYYVTASKNLRQRFRLPLAPYAGLSWSTHEDRLLVPFGMNVALGERWSAMLLNDGVHTHLSASVGYGRFSLTLLAIERRDFGLTLGAAF